MKSEKVKEIKKALEERIQHKPINCYNGEYVEACGMYCRFHRKFVADMGSKNGQTCENCIDFTATDKVKECVDILTLINELESENERLLQQRNKTYNIWVKDTEQLKDRIAELEKENGELLKENEGYHGSYRCAIDKIGELSAERYIKVEQFAERLKEKIVSMKWAREDTNEKLIKQGATIKAIDETLKEFINE
jgi:predicted S18 family serine protease